MNNKEIILPNKNFPDIKKSLAAPEYDFLREPKTKKKIILLNYGGSISYGTNLAGSDIDIRGISVKDKASLLGLPSIGINNKEQAEDNKTDTVIYDLQKIVRLFLDCNPNTIEMLYTLPEHRIVNVLGQILIDFRDIFLSQLATHSFNGMAISQLYRLQNALSKDGRMALADELRYEADRLNNMVHHFNNVYHSFDYGSFSFNIDLESENPTVTISNNLVNYPLEDLTGIYSEINTFANSWKKYKKLKEREKEAKKLNKHAMHLIRLYMMGTDILLGKEVSTYRGDPKEHELLMSIRNGLYMNDDGTYSSHFFNLVKEYQQRFEDAKRVTKLPVRCNLELVNKLLFELQSIAIEEDFEEIEF